MIYGNNSRIAITEIGEELDNAGLQCRTDLATCCDHVQGGFWRYPNGSLVRIESSNEGFYRNRGDRVVFLFRRTNVTQPTGLYCCEILTVANPESFTRICVHLYIGKLLFQTL